MSVTPARTLIMKMGGNSMCHGSGIWTSGAEHNGAAFDIPDFIVLQVMLASDCLTPRTRAASMRRVCCLMR